MGGHGMRDLKFQISNFVISPVLLLALVGNAFSEEPKQPPKELTVDLGNGVKLAQLRQLST
jgi:hypothetical protein